MPLPTTSPAGDSVRSLHLSDFDLRFDRYRLIQPKADLLMARSLAKYSQHAPVICCQLERSLVLVDGFKRLRSARTLKGITSLQAHHLTQLQRCNQNAAMQSATEHALTSRELSETVKLLQSASTQEQTQFVLEKPREAIRQSQDNYVHQWDPRLSTAGNRAAKRLGFLLDAAAEMNHWLRLTGRFELQACDRPILLPSFVKLQNEASILFEAATDFIKELQQP